MQSLGESVPAQPEKFGGHEWYGRRRPSLKRIGAWRVRGRIAGKPLHARNEFRQAPKSKAGRSVERRGHDAQGGVIFPVATQPRHYQRIVERPHAALLIGQRMALSHQLGSARRGVWKAR